MITPPIKKPALETELVFVMISQEIIRCVGEQYSLIKNHLF